VIATSFLAGDEARSHLLGELAEEVRLVEHVLREQVRSQVGLVSEVGAHTLSAGGKRLRPALLSLAARATGMPYERERAHRLGACMEMIHMATLIHDDVIDHAATRRGRSTAAAVFGNTASILSGDVLLSKAMAILAQDGDLEIIRLVSSAVVDLAEGEVRELEVRGQFDLSEIDHYEILRMKTATFIQCCCEVGARLADAPREMQAALGRYGYHLGLAFQLVDDLLDYRGDHAKTGKPLATDFREGCATLPLILLRPHLNPHELDEAKRWFGNGSSEEDIRLVCGWMAERLAFQGAEAAASDQVRQANEALAALPASPDRDLLGAVADFVLSRQT
jgi:octaprenyl-diphosphate synthase